MDWSQTSGCLSKPDNVATLNCAIPLFHNIVNTLIIFAGVVAVFLIVIGGIKLINSGGDPKQLEGAKKTITYALVGLVLILSSFLIINFISNITGAKCIRQVGFFNCR